ncbi:hypothetical protein Hanom_Chr11g00986191 [Helianthus anomalus]
MVEVAESVVGEDVEIEEGEVRISDVCGDVNIPALENDLPESGTIGEEGGESEAEGDRVHGEPVDCEELHGETSQPLKTNGTINLSGSPNQLENVCGKVQPTFDLNKSVGSFSVGSTGVESVIRTKKWPRRCRSPTCEESIGPEGHEVGPGSNCNPLHELIKRSRVVSVDPNPYLFTDEQNNNVVPSGDAEEVLAGVGGSNRGQDPDIRAAHPGTNCEPEPGENGTEAGKNQAEAGDGDIDSVEVRATMEVGQ